jgi:sulfotransferase
MTSPVWSFVDAVVTKMGPGAEFSVFLDDDKRRTVLRGIFESYYAEQDGAVVFDTNRAWCARMDLVAELFPDARVIACARQLGWVVNSIERQFKSVPMAPPAIFQGATVYSRVEAISRGDGVVGSAWTAMKEAYYGTHANKMMVLRYETLTTCPTQAIDAIYDFIGEDRYSHDFNNVVFDDAAAREYDARAGIPGLHSVGAKIKPQTPRIPIIPPELFMKSQTDNFWENETLNSRNVKVV